MVDCEDPNFLNRASLAHGTPPHVHPRQFDVPIPDVAALNIGGGHVDRTSRSFLALCQLTEILGDILPFIYDIKGRAPENQTRSLKRVEAALEDWEANLPDVLNARNPDFQREHPGALNLELSFLAVKMCVSRVSLLVRISYLRDLRNQTDVVPAGIE